MKNAVFWDVTPRGSCKKRRFGEHSASIIWVAKIGELGTTLVFLRSARWLLVAVNVVPGLPILVTPMMEALRFFEMSAPTRATRRNIPEDGILHSHRRENLISYIQQQRLDINVPLQNTSNRSTRPR
jgi:hypothetical protein